MFSDSPIQLFFIRILLHGDLFAVTDDRLHRVDWEIAVTKDSHGKIRNLDRIPITLFQQFKRIIRTCENQLPQRLPVI